MKVLLDTKWKLLDATDNKYGVKQEDMYQMLAYAHQYKCHNVVLIYPQNSNIADRAPVFETIIGEVKIFIWTVDLSGLAGFGPDVSTQLSSRLSSLLTSLEQ